MDADGAAWAQAAAAGFALGFGLLFSIGPRTLQLVRSGLAGFHPVTTAVASYLSDLVLAAAAVGGFGVALAARPRLAVALQIVGVAFLLWCGARSLLRARRPAGPVRLTGAAASRRAAVRAILSVCWLNPLFYVETLLLVGALSAGYAGSARLFFAAGFLAAAALKSFGWVSVGVAFARRLGDPEVRARFETAAGAILIVAAALLASRLAGVAA